MLVSLLKSTFSDLQIVHLYSCICRFTHFISYIRYLKYCSFQLQNFHLAFSNIFYSFAKISYLLINFNWSLLLPSRHIIKAALKFFSGNSAYGSSQGWPHLLPFFFHLLFMSNNFIWQRILDGILNFTHALSQSLNAVTFSKEYLGFCFSRWWVWITKLKLWTISLLVVINSVQLFWS